MDKNQKDSTSQHKTGNGLQTDKTKDSSKHDTSSKKMMDEKSAGKSEKGMHASSDKSSKGK